MTSEKQVAANRKNAKRSTGPGTEAGKKNVSTNAMKLGFRARTVVLPDEDPAEFDELVQRLYAEYGPIGEQQCQQVDRIAEYNWRLGRAPRIEAGILTHYSREVARKHALRMLMEDPENDSLVAVVKKNKQDIDTALTKVVAIEEELTRQKNPAADDADPERADPGDPGQKDTAETTTVPLSYLRNNASGVISMSCKYK